MSFGRTSLNFCVIAVLFVMAFVSHKCRCFRLLDNGAVPRHPPTSGRRRLADPNNVFDVMSYGAKGDGSTDDTKAFQKAWNAACGNEASSVTLLKIPAGYKFLLAPLTLQGPCQSSVCMQVEGTLLGQKPSKWKSAQLKQWINISKVKGMTVNGSGTIDSKGSLWWSRSGDRPTALRFYGSEDVTVKGITLRNSAKAHLKFDSCSSVTVKSITVSSPEDSPNTDGVHLQNTQNVQIQSSTIACGDDCVSIQTGCSDIAINSVDCGPGHGISIGSLGEDSTKACVSNITVSDCTVHDAQNGLRIKTWQGGMGSVRHITFSNIQVKNVEAAMKIDQYYCDGGSSSKCHNQSSAVSVSGLTFQNIQGTYVDNSIWFACSDDVACTGISLSNVQLQAAKGGSSSSDSAFCWNAYGNTEEPISPRDILDCVMSGSSANYSSSSSESTC